MHHEAHTFRTQTLPRMSSAEKVFAGSFSCGRRNVGAALLIKGEGTSCGSRPSPIARKTTSTRKIPSGNKYLSMMVFASLRLHGKTAAHSTGRILSTIFAQRRKEA